MKKIYILSFLILLVSSCIKEKKTEKKTTNIFLTIHNKIEVSKGDLVLAPSQATYDTALSKGLKTTLFVFYPRKVISQKGNYIYLDEYGDTSKMPKSLVIPLDKDKKVSKGQFLLTWWQKGTGMQRAIVLGKNPTLTPIVYYFDNQYSYISPLKNINYWIDTLQANSFLVLKDSLMPGTTVKKAEAYSPVYIVISFDNKKIIGLNWAGNIEILDRKKCIFPKIYKQLQKNDSIEMPYVGLYAKGKIISIWKDIGKLKANITFFDTTFQTYGNIADAIKLQKK